MSFCTIIARNYLAQAKTLTQSIRKFYSTAKIWVAFVDKAPREFLEDPQDFDWVTLDKLGIPDLDSFCFKYSCLELSTAIKPYFLKYLLDARNTERLIYLDPDILLLRALKPVEAALEEASIVLTPHLISPTRDLSTPTELDVLRAGVYNLGFIALKNSDSSQRFLQWWETKLYEGCQIDLDRGMHVDQRWIDLVPAYFPETQILRQPGLNIAYWNLRDRALFEREGHWFVDVQPAYFFHFSGFNPNEPEIISRHYYPQRVIDTPSLRALHSRYAKALKENGYDGFFSVPVSFSQFDNGETIPKRLRAEYREMNPSERHRFGNPFDTHSQGSLYQWWQRGIRTKKASNGPNDTLEHSSYPFGINLYGFLEDRTSLTAVASQFCQSIMKARIPLSTYSVNGTHEAPTLPSVRQRPCPIYNINLFIANADWTELKIEDESDHLGGRYNVGFWSWETTQFPQKWEYLLKYFDELWVPSTFMKDAIQPISTIPIVVVPPSVEEFPALAENVRARFGVSDDATLFLFAFDWRSYKYRKNPDSTIRAFQKAFPAGEKVQLLIKTRNAEMYGEDHQQLIDLASHDGRIRIWNGELSAHETRQLIQSSDAFVSLHRAEGLGMFLAEAMLESKPVIATGFSGNMDFMNESNSLPVRYTLKPLERAIGPYAEGTLWAEADIDDAAKKLRWVFTNREEAQAMGQRAQSTIRFRHSPSSIGHQILLRLAQLGLSKSKVPDRMHPHSRRLTWLEGHHDVTQVDLTTTGSLKKPLGSVKRLAARLLWPVFYRQTQFNFLSVEELADLRREVTLLRQQVKDMHRGIS